jgi:hypothetical protein
MPALPTMPEVEQITEFIRVLPQDRSEPVSEHPTTPVPSGAPPTPVVLGRANYVRLKPSKPWRTGMRDSPPCSRM